MLMHQRDRLRGQNTTPCVCSCRTSITELLTEAYLGYGVLLGLATDGTEKSRER